MATPIRRIDQIYAQAASIGDVNKLYYLFAHILGFPEAWPPKDRKTYYGGGVYTGNTWLKWTTSNLKDYPITDKPAKFKTISAEPTNYSKTLKELEKRGFTHTPDSISTSLNGSGVDTEWCRSTRINESPFREVDFSLCKYSSFAFSCHTPTTEAKDLHEHYRMMKARLDEVGGGPLGIRYVKEVELGVRDFNEDMRRWGVLLAPLKPYGPDTWRIGSGPMLRLVEDRDYAIRSIAIKVGSLRRANRLLKGFGLLGEAGEGFVALDATKINDLSIKFVK